LRPNVVAFEDISFGERLAAHKIQGNLDVAEVNVAFLEVLGHGRKS
jgi:hypothetical protein